MKILCIGTISSLFLILHFLINYVVVPGDAVVVILNKGMIRKPQPARKPSAAVIVAPKPIRRTTKGKKTKRKWSIIKNWISRVLRKNGGLRSQACCKKHNVTRDNRRTFNRYNKENLNR